MRVWWITLASSYLLCLIAHNKHFIKESPKKGMTILAIPAGILLTGYIKHNVRK